MLTKAPMPCAVPRYRTQCRTLLCRHRGLEIMRAFALLFPMVLTHAPLLARLRRCALAAAPQARACVLRAQQVQSHGVPSAFVSLSGVTAMLSAAVRKA